MSTLAASGWTLASFALYLAGALACAVVAVWLARRGEADRPDRTASLCALALTAGWCVVCAAYGPASNAAMFGETLRDLGWLHVLFRLFEVDGRHVSMKAIRPLIGAIAFVEGLQPALLLLRAQYAGGPGVASLVAANQAMFNMLVAIATLVMLHNLYVGASLAARQVLRWSALGLAVFWLYELNLATVAYLGGSVLQLRALFGLVVILTVFGIAMGANPVRAKAVLVPSRAMAFQTLSLLVIGTYLLVMFLFAQGLDLIGGDLGRLAQVGVVFFGLLTLLYWTPSRRLRDWLRVAVLKNLFQHRYDYRAEWLRFNQTIGQGGTVPLPDRVVQALADITESSSGLLLMPDEAGDFVCASRWQWPGIDVPQAPLSPELAALLAKQQYIVELDDVRAGVDRHGECALVGEWLTADPRCWAMVPLLHFNRLTGVVVLSRPLVDRRLDWEDLDLLKVAGKQLASYLAESHMQRALMDAARFDEFNRRMAFVLHDIKNLASQLGLLARNAEKHADNPAFRADMLVTLRNSSDKLTALLARLGRYGAGGGEARTATDLGELVNRVAASFSANHPVVAVVHAPCRAVVSVEGLEQALCHLIQNGIDASGPGSPVFVELSQADVAAKVQVVDAGIGMTPDFVRTGLFKPFVSSKTNGFGIGAFEARELIRAMGGSLDVDSREGLGTRFLLTFPLAGEVADTDRADEAA